MKLLVLLTSIVAACASAPRVDDAVFEGVETETVREAARVIMEEIVHHRYVVRVTDDRLLTEGRFGECGKHVACGQGTVDLQQNTGTPWTTMEIRLLDLGEDTGLEVDLRYETRAHCPDQGDVVGCVAEPLPSSGALERELIEGIRALLKASESS